MPKYTKQENAKFKLIQTHLKVLEERTRRLKSLIKTKKKRGDLNKTEVQRVLKKIKKAKLNIADAEFI